MVSSSTRDAWSGLLGDFDWESAIGNPSGVVTFSRWAPPILHIRRIDKDSIDALGLRPEGRETPINLYALGEGDDISVLDSHVFSVGGANPMALGPLYQLAPSVRHLGLGGVAVAHERLRLRDLFHVRSVAIDWGLLDLATGYGPSLRCLEVAGYRPHDLGDLAVEGCERIEQLSIIQGRALEDLAGLEAFRSLPRFPGQFGLGDHAAAVAAV